jgi:hypothetical protein
MKETQQLVDRSQWPPGPWDSEGFDRADWTDKSSGFECYIKRNIMGAWCGYVVVPYTRGGAMAGLDVPDARQAGDRGWTWLETVSVHGGVTYAKRQDENDDTSPMVVGFDCCHCEDVYPRTLSFRPPSRCTPDSIKYDGYKTAEFAIRECSQLAGQLRASHAAAPTAPSS